MYEYQSSFHQVATLHRYVAEVPHLCQTREQTRIRIYNVSRKVNKNEFWTHNRYILAQHYIRPNYRKRPNWHSWTTNTRDLGFISLYVFDSTPLPVARKQLGESPRWPRQHGSWKMTHAAADRTLTPLLWLQRHASTMRSCSTDHALSSTLSCHQLLPVHKWFTVLQLSNWDGKYWL